MIAKGVDRLAADQLGEWLPDKFGRARPPIWPQLALTASTRQSGPTSSSSAQGWMLISKDPLEDRVHALQMIAEVEQFLELAVR